MAFYVLLVETKQAKGEHLMISDIFKQEMSLKKTNGVGLKKKKI